jgi:nitronate monooxygenase
MGVYVSGYPLARAVSRAGQIGVVSVTAIEQVFVRKLQLGDVGDALKRAASHFPDNNLVKRVWERYSVPKTADKPYQVPTWRANPKKSLVELSVLAAFCEVWLAREGHKGQVGINMMQKLQLPTLPYLYGALLAKIDYLLVGAGIPSQFSGFVDTLTKHLPTRMRLTVASPASGEARGGHELHFDPKEYVDVDLPDTHRPRFLPIITSHILAKHLLAKAGQIDGFIVENPTAGGHNAPPRQSGLLNELGEPVYSRKDDCDLAEMRNLGVPFYLAGGYGDPVAFQQALSEGAAGVQVGTPFALCEESGITRQMKDKLMDEIEADNLSILASATVSPTGFPFQLAQVEGSLTQACVYESRTRICDVGLLVELYEKEDGSFGTRCSAEPREVYEMKGGTAEGSEGRRCLCNGLLSTVGLPQFRKKRGLTMLTEEPPVVTLGKDLSAVRHFMAQGQRVYSATDVIEHITG